MNTDVRFTGSIPQLYDRHLRTLFFQPFADDVAARVARSAPKRVLEVAAGTGIVTRALARALGPDVAITATDLNDAMIAHAASHPDAKHVEFKQADALSLPFADGSFDAVVCQFGVMFFPDRVRGHREAKRVLRGGGTYFVATWDRVEANDVTDVVHQTVIAMFPDDPPAFFARTPHGYHDVARIRADLEAAGFADVSIDAVDAEGFASSAKDAAIGTCQGTPLRNELEARAPGRLEEITDLVARAIAKRFGDGEIRGRQRAFVATAR
jgi:ubiquinone/menaquinone biosynthesis C-methylase UbiE